MLSVPRFLQYSRNVVTWWYLYSPSRELDAIIMEINNSFDEKRNVLFRVHGKKDLGTAGPGSGNSHMDSTLSLNSPPKLSNRKRTIRYLDSLPRSNFYEGFWGKGIFASPFEKVEGSISVRVKDPLDRNFQEHDKTLSNTTSIGLSGKPRMSTRITLCGDPLDPMQESYMSTLQFLIRWTLPGLSTSLRIVYQAMKLHYYKGTLRMMDKPDIREGSIPRHASKSEKYHVLFLAIALGLLHSRLIFIQGSGTFFSEIS